MRIRGVKRRAVLYILGAAWKMEELLQRDTMQEQNTAMPDIIEISIRRQGRGAGAVVSRQVERKRQAAPKPSERTDCVRKNENTARCHCGIDRFPWIEAEARGGSHK